MKIWICSFFLQIIESCNTGQTPLPVEAKWVTPLGPALLFAIGPITSLA